MKKETIIYQTKNGSLEFKGDFKNETIWASQAQIAALFDVERSVITKHIKNIFSDEELDEKLVSAKFAHTTSHGAVKGKTQTRDVSYYNLDIILAVGYRTKSSVAMKFRQWATKTLRKHITEGYTIDKKHISKNYDAFLKAVEDVKKLLPSGEQVGADDVLELVKMFASTWFSLDAYDHGALPKTGITKKQVMLSGDMLARALNELRTQLIVKNEASELFGNEREKGGLAGIVGNIFQSFGGRDLYPTQEEKAAHLLYFIVKNHPFSDGNKRSGAFAFVWFLRKVKLLDTEKMTPEALTTLTLLVAESNPKDKDRMIGLILMLLRK